MIARTNRQWRLAKIPQGTIESSDFEWGEQPVPDIEDGQVLARNLYLSLDPANRVWISGRRSYVEPVEIGDVMRGGTVSVIEESKSDELAPGDIVQGQLGWQDYAVVDSRKLVAVPKGLPFPLEAYAAVLNHIGLTAYFGLLDIGKPKEGETVVVSAAAGAVGSLVGQIAKIKGCRAIGIAGSDDKCKWLTEDLGFDGAINRRTEDIGDRVTALCPDGVDIYFDNVGGDMLDVMLTRMNLHGRIPLCGMISLYNATELLPGPRNLSVAISRRLRLEGFVVIDYLDRFMEFAMHAGPWLGTGKLAYRLDVVDGLENAAAALPRLFSGDNIGKLAVKVSAL